MAAVVAMACKERQAMRRIVFSRRGKETSSGVIVIFSFAMEAGNYPAKSYTYSLMKLRSKDRDLAITCHHHQRCNGKDQKQPAPQKPKPLPSKSNY